MTRLIPALTLALAAALPAQNLLTNPGFETGNFNGWTVFGNVFNEFTVPPQFVPHNGSNNLCSTFGNFSGSFNATGLYQTFPASEGDVFQMDCYTRHFSGDPMIGGGQNANGNFCVMKIVFRDAGGVEIGAAERVVLDGTFPTDTWLNHLPIQGRAPAGTSIVEAFLLYLQPGLDGGAAHWDDVTFEIIPLGMFFSQDATTLDTSVQLAGGLPFTQYGMFYSFDTNNGIFAGLGAFGGLFIDPNDLAAQINFSLLGVPLFGGALDVNGETLQTLPGGLVSGLSGLTIYGVGAQVNVSGGIDFSNLAALTFM